MSDGDAASYRAVDPRQITTKLRDLKRKGCTILVTGDVPSEASARVSRKLFGAPEESRERVFVRLSDGDVARDDWFPDGVDTADVFDVDFASDTRSIAIPNGGTGPESSPSGFSNHPPLVEVKEEVSLAFLRAANSVDLDTASLRVGLYSLAPVVDRHSIVDVRSFASFLQSHSREVAAMTHVHYPVRHDTDAVVSIRDSFDACIDLRIEDGQLEQQWYFPDVGWSGWLPVRERDSEETDKIEGGGE